MTATAKAFAVKLISIEGLNSRTKSTHLTDSSTANMSTTVTKYKPLSELTLIVPNVHGWKSYTSHNRDVGFHSYTNEPALFTMEVPDSYQSPTSLLLKAPDKSIIASCTHTPSAKDHSWEIVVPFEMGETDKLVSKEEQEYAKTAVYKVGKEDYNLSTPWLQPTSTTSVASSAASTFSIAATLVPLPEQREAFHWRKQVRPDSTAATFTNPDWKLVNAHTGEVQAVFIGKWGVKERGSMQFRRSFGKEWELSVVLSIGLIVEEGRRRKKARGNFTAGFNQGHVFS